MMNNSLFGDFKHTSFSLFSVCSESVLSKNSDVVQTTLVALEEFCVNNIPPGIDEYEVCFSVLISSLRLITSMPMFNWFLLLIKSIMIIIVAERS